MMGLKPNCSPGYGLLGGGGDSVKTGDGAGIVVVVCAVVGDCWLSPGCMIVGKLPEGGGTGPNKPSELEAVDVRLAVWVCAGGVVAAGAGVLFVAGAAFNSRIFASKAARAAACSGLSSAWTAVTPAQSAAAQTARCSLEILMTFPYLNFSLDATAFLFTVKSLRHTVGRGYAKIERTRIL